MSKQKLRSIHIEKQIYFWTISSEYRHSDCGISLTIYQGEQRKSPIRIFFRESDSLEKRQQPSDECWLVSNVGKGLIWKTSAGTDAVQVVNLNHPGVVAAIAKSAIQQGWSPATMNSPMEIYDGFEWIDVIDFPIPRGDK